MSSPDIAQLSETQQGALQTYTAVTNQDPLAAIALLQRCEWNVEIAITRFFDGEPATDPLAEAAAAQAASSIPAPTSRQTANLHYESLLAANSPPVQQIVPENAVQRVDTTATVVPAYQPPFPLSILVTPFNLLFRLFSTVLSPVSFLIPSFASRILRNLLTFSSRPTRRQLPPADTARRFIREFEETYSPNPPLPFVESGFNLALDNCKKDSKFLLVVLLSPSHDETHTWVRDTLMSSQLHEFLQTHQHELVLWGGSVQDAEGYQVSTSLNCTKFPFAALICQTAESTGTSTRPGNMTVVMRAVGPMAPSELVAKIGASMTAQQAQLSAARAQRVEQQAQRNLRQEQDSAYERSLAQDRERARQKREDEQAKALAEKQALEAEVELQKRQELREAWRLWRAHQIPREPDASSSDVVRLSIRLLDGQRLVRKFDGNAPLEHLYAFVECYDILDQSSEREASPPLPTHYKHEYAFHLVSPMPRKVIDLEAGGTISGRVGRGANLIVEELDAPDELVQD